MNEIEIAYKNLVCAIYLQAVTDYLQNKYSYNSLERLSYDLLGDRAEKFLIKIRDMKKEGIKTVNKFREVSNYDH